MIQLGRFQLDLAMRVLRLDGEVVQLGSRAFDILALLVTAGGRLVTKNELMNTVWPDTIVEENNIQVHMSALRKVLGPDRALIHTVPGRGYKLMRPHDHAISINPIMAPAVPRPCSLPKHRLIGRDGDLSTIRAISRNTPLLTLVGAGGIGKTSLAIEVARQIAAETADYVLFVELAAARTQDDVLVAMAESCGLSPSDGALSTTRLKAALLEKPRLIVLDNTEQVVEEVATIVQALIADNDSLSFLVTSREPLRIVSEVIFRVGPLAVPQPDCNDIEILRCSAVDLFLSRAKSPQNRVGSDSKEIRLVGEICRRLDGIPLAIELAAARLHSLGVEGVHRHLDDRMAILGGGYRTALPRHQTLRATFDWSFALLDANTRMLFRRLALFGARFTFEGMCAVVCDQKLSIASAISGIGELVAKSLVTAEFEGPVAQYRLSESARAYALEKLQAEGERKEVAARNARYLSTRIQTRLEERHRSGRATSSEIQSSLEDARNAYEWAFSTEGDALLGIELASNLACALFDCGLLEECCACASHAVDAIDNMPPKSVDVISEMRLRTALAMALPYVRGTISALVTLWQQVLRLATEADDVEYQARAIWGLWNTMISRADIHAAKSYATQFRSLTLERGTPWQQVLARQLCAILRHFQGHHAEAKAELLRAREQYMQHHAGVHHAGSFYVEPLVFCNGSLARIAWLQGDPDAAMALADDLVNLVRPAAMEPSLTHVLGATAIPLALMSGDLQRSAHYIKVMRSQAALHGFEIWRDYCNCLSANHDILEGRIKQGLAQLSASLDSLVARGFRRVITPLIVACAEAMTAMGQTAQARERLDAALTYCNNHDERLFLPEVWRALGAVARAEAEAPGQTIEARSEKVAQADACFHTAIDLARAHGAVMFELRASIALAGLLKAEGRIQATLDLLVGLSTQFNRNSTATDIRVLFEMMHDLQSDTAQPTPRNPRIRSKRELHSIDH